MCGIIAIISFLENFTFLINGLKQLQNRGYDSAGIAFLSENKFSLLKYATTKNQDSIKLLEKNKDLLKHSSVGIGHTRWATHGGISDKNSHPHLSYDEKICLVHNGIIENYLELKQFLIDKIPEIIFKSETDTEIIAHLIAYYYQLEDDMEIAIEIASKKLKGTWGLALMNLDFPNKLFFTRNGSPILLGCDDEKLMVVSEKSGFNGAFKHYMVLDNLDIGVAEIINQKIILKTGKKYSPRKIDMENFDLTPDPFPHWTLKEIYEQEISSARAFNFGGRILNESMVKLGGLEEHEKQLKEIKNLILLGCGTSLNACNFTRRFFMDLSDFNNISCYDGAEFEEIFIPKNGKTAFILVSQSGETKDLHRCIEIGKKNNCLLIGVVNVVESMIAREVDCGVYTNAGREVGVASTKAFTNQVIVLILMAIYFSQIHHLNENKRIRYLQNLRKIPSQIKETILISEKNQELFLNLLLKAQSLFILGKGNAKFIADEGSLKIKEISYIHSESYSGSALKHGPFALLDENLPVILLFNQNKYLDKMLNTYHEVKSRNSPILVLSDIDLKLSNNLVIPYNEIFGELLLIYPLQIMAYYLSINKNLDCDKPRNLAKCVNVE